MPSAAASPPFILSEGCSPKNHDCIKYNAAARCPPSDSSFRLHPSSFHLMIVTLIGYRGTGKTSVAGPLAVRLGFRAVDTDAEIERRAGRTIREIFADEGEAGFRTREHDVMAEYLALDQL